LGVKSFYFWFVFWWVSPEKTAAPPPSPATGVSLRERERLCEKKGKQNEQMNEKERNRVFIPLFPFNFLLGFFSLNII
jgi:hypothetical protein